MATKSTDRHLDKAYDDEPIFVLLARDPSAAFIVIEWIKANLTTQSDEKLREAFEHALKMRGTCNIMRQRVVNNVPNKKVITQKCPKCGSSSVIMFTADLDLCNDCGHTF